LSVDRLVVMAKASALDQRWLGDTVQTIVQRYKPIRVVLFGSYARGDYNAASDLDLFLLVPDAGEWFDRGVEFKRLLHEERVPIEAHIYTAQEYARMKAMDNPLVLQIEREGRVLYEQQ
jgi:predicted nucleotidyltransferase